MNEFDTYNRVKQLEKQERNWHFVILSLLFLIISVVAGVYFLGEHDAWTIAAAGISLALFLLLAFHGLKHTKHCQYCGSELDVIQRPFMYKNWHFDEGVMIDGQIYMPTPWSAIGLKRRWSKLYQWSLACHHCRVYEDCYHESSMPATAEELQKINIKG